LNPSEFARKWSDSKLKERSGCQEHFIDLCRLVGHPTPAEIDKTGASFCFERGAPKYGGGQGWADVWKRGHFGWEYKGNNKDLEIAYGQLLQYREALENPPLLVVSDFERIIIHTNFTNTPSEVHELSLQDFNTDKGIAILRAIFHDPDKLRPGITSQGITSEAASHIGQLAQRLRARGEEPHAVARFLDRLVFCMFAEDIDLLPNGLFGRILDKSKHDPDRFEKLMSGLFEAMASGGDFGMESIPYFNGSLFETAEVLRLERPEIEILYEASQLDWDAIDPSIFGTLFERGLDPDKRSQFGAHYTSHEDIETLVAPVVLAPLRREWGTVRAEVLAASDKSKERTDSGVRRYTDATARKHRQKAVDLVRQFLGRLTDIKILDPACGSGNFLYVSLQMLKNFEKEIIRWAQEQGLDAPLPLVHPRQLYGIELNPYAYGLAQMTVWIGHLQWIKANGFGSPPEPILQTLEGNFRNCDAIVDLTDPAGPREPEWPKVDFIVGNPPFLGGKLLRTNLGDSYVESMFDVWRNRVPAEADLCCYWFEKARAQVASGQCRRAGLLATQGIRGGANREVLKRIKESGDIFFAESARPWVLDGANVHISMVGFDNGADGQRVLDGTAAAQINANLTASAADITQARPLAENSGIAFMGDTKGGAFDIPEAVALDMLAQPNPHGKPNSDVLTPWVNGMDLTRRSRGMWIVDFGVGMGESEAAMYAAPFKHVQEHVLPVRRSNKRESYRRLYWQHVEARPALRSALAELPRFLATPTVAKHRLFVWMTAPTLPDHQLIVFARADDYFAGILQSRFHEIWSRAQATQLREASSGTRYTPTSCFETFPFPWPLGQEPTDSAEVKAIADAAAQLSEMRERWLNPPEWVRHQTRRFGASAGGVWKTRLIPGAGANSEAEYQTLVPIDATTEKGLGARTLTALYNEMPQWLRDAHDRLDHAVAQAYVAATGTGESVNAVAGERVLDLLLKANLSRDGT
jgi:type II restriction/modification system DNA methylase subunit YeeA